MSRIHGFLAVILVVGATACQQEVKPTTTIASNSGSEEGESDLFLILEEGKWGFMNPEGHLAIGPYFDRAWPFSDERALVEIDGRFGYIDRNGDTVIQPQFLDAWYFSKGLAPVQTDKGWAYIDTAGKIIVASEHPSTFVGPENQVQSLDIDRVRVGDLYGFRSADGQIVIDPQFEQAWHFADGLARIKKNGKWGFIDRKGTQVVAAAFDVAWDFDRGLARVQVGDKYGYINKVGRYVWEPTN